MSSNLINQHSTRSNLLRDRLPAFTQLLWLLKTESTLKGLLNWSSQTISFQGVSELERIWMVTGVSTVSVPQTDVLYLNQLHLLQRWYIFRGQRIEIVRFLERYPFLVSLLIEAYYYIVEFFPHSPVYLAITADPEEFGRDQLTVFIATDLGPDEAVEVLSRFDKKWWLNSLKRAQGKLCITLEFQ